MIKLVLNMRTISTILLAFSFYSVVVVNCAQSSKQSRKPVTTIQIQPEKNSYYIGDKLTVIIKTKIKDGSLSKSELFLDEKEIYNTCNPETSYVIETAGMNFGIHYLKVVAVKKDGTSGENYANFLLLPRNAPIKYTYKIVSTYPHNPHHFTQGFEIHDGFLYEGTGREGESGIYKIDLKTWKVVKERKIDTQYFGEGITIWDDKLYELTYKSKIGFIYDLNTFQPLKTWTFRSAEGWGLTNDGSSLIMSDGTEYLTYINPVTLLPIKKIQVCSNTGVIKNLNELEYIKGEIWANIWLTNNIVRINPNTGEVVGEIDLTGLLSTASGNQNEEEDVLNGIAYDQIKNKIYVTGKLWPKIFEIELIKE